MSNAHGRNQQLNKMSGNSEFKLQSNLNFSTGLSKEDHAKGKGFKRTWPQEMVGNKKVKENDADQKPCSENLDIEDTENEMYDPDDTNMLSDLNPRSGDSILPDLENECWAFSNVNASQGDPPCQQTSDLRCQPNESLPEEGDAGTLCQESSYSTGKRENTPSLDDYFMAMAYLASVRSKDPVTQVGAVVVKEDRIIGTGYNKMPKGLSDDKFSWNKGKEDEFDNKHLFVVHAEENAIDNADKNMEKGCTIYVTLFPCNKCARVLLNKGFKEVVYMDDRDKTSYRASRWMLGEGGITYRQHRITRDARQQISNKFNLLNENLD